jgi:predicted ATPase/DNA-binding CsgD family transcriptional regulator
VALVDLGVHRLRDLGRPEQVLEVTHPKLRRGFPPLRSLDAVPNNLPVQLTSFIGRDRELADVRRLLRQHRLVTLTGAGGCGKTRLAVHVAGDLAVEHPDGAWWVELAPLTDEARVAGEVLDVLRISDTAGRQLLQDITAHLATRQLLIVLDNCEHVLGASAALSEAVLRSCPGVDILATSREPLGVPGEVTWRVPPLSFPSKGDPVEVTSLDTYDAVRLFVERAVGARPNFTVTNDTAPAVAEICTRLDGIPLAIELAAARTRALAPKEILTGLEDRFRLLTGGARSVLPRQQTLEASVAWSHDLLSEAERALFRRLAVFAGGFTLSGVEAVCAGNGVERFAVLDLLDQLVAKSLVVVDDDQGAESRFRLFETVRQFAAAQLQQTGETAARRDAHLRYFVDVAADIEAALLSATAAVVAAAAVEIDNLRLALDWALAGADADAALALAARLEFLLVHQGRCSEAREWAERALALDGGSDDLRGRAHWALGHAAFHQADFHATARAAEATLEWGERADDTGLLARGHQLRYWHGLVTDPAGVRESLDEATRLAEAAGDSWVLMDVPSGYIYVACRADRYAEAAEWATRGEQVCREGGNDYLLAWVLASAAPVVICQGHLEGGIELAREAIELASDIGDGVAASYAAIALAEAELLRGHPAAAAAAAEKGLHACSQAASELMVAQLLTLSGRAAWALNEPNVPTRLAEAVTLWERLGNPCLAVSTPLAMARYLVATGHAADAATHVEAAIALDRGGTSFGTKRVEADAADVRAAISAAEGDYARAEDLRHTALALRTANGYVLDIPASLEGVAGSAAATESWTEAARLLGAAGRLRREYGCVPDPLDQAGADAAEAASRKALGDAAYETAFAEGGALTSDEAIAYATRARGERGRPSFGWASLTPTELDVARLAAEGGSNADIGQRLFMAAGTVKVHLAHIYAKLGVANRTELAAEAARRGL